MCTCMSQLRKGNWEGVDIQPQIWPRKIPDDHVISKSVLQLNVL